MAAVREEHPVTLRGVYYRVVSAGAVEKTEDGYRLVGRQLLKLRRTGAIPYEWITDGTRWMSRPQAWSDLDQMLRDAASSYRRQLWRDQRVDVYVFSEKEAITGAISRVTEQWGVPLGVLRGHASETFAHVVAQQILASTKPAYLYQLGDHDPSGVDAWRDFQEKVAGFIGGIFIGDEVFDYNETGGIVTLAHFERIAVTPHQIRLWDLPTRPTKRTDPRSHDFEGGSVEVDAIPPTELRQLVEDTIVSHIDEEAYQLTLVAEESERDILTRMIGNAA